MLSKSLEMEHDFRDSLGTVGELYSLTFLMTVCSILLYCSTNHDESSYPFIFLIGFPISTKFSERSCFQAGNFLFEV